VLDATDPQPRRLDHFASRDASADRQFLSAQRLAADPGERGHRLRGKRFGQSRHRLGGAGPGIRPWGLDWRRTTWRWAWFRKMCSDGAGALARYPQAPYGLLPPEIIPGSTGLPLRFDAFRTFATLVLYVALVFVIVIAALGVFGPPH
jgi:hypothetical protein